MEIAGLIDAIIRSRGQLEDSRALLCGISGIDACGKGFISDRLSTELRGRGFNVAQISVDGWLNLPEVRFDALDLPGNFYRNGLRLDEMFEQLILPLKERRSISLVADFTEEIATVYRKHVYDFEDIDIILLEGIFLFKKEYAAYFDLRVWIECPFETALERAVARAQEGLGREETVSAYETIYFPAQYLHFDRDDPRKTADLVFHNE